MHIRCDPVFPFLRTHMARETSLQRYQVMYIVVRINLVIITKQNTQISINRMNSGIFIQWNAI